MIREAEALDRSNMEGLIANFWKQCQDARKLAGRVRVSQKPPMIIIAAMGGSSISGELLKCYLPQLNIAIVRDYELPAWVPKQSLIFVISYSGNTEESLSMYQDAHRKLFPIISISSGGKLEQMAIAKNTPHIKIPTGIPPRMALGNLFIPLIVVLQNSGIIPNKDEEIDKAVQSLQDPKHKRIGEELAKRLYDRTPLIYASNRFFAVAERWKTDINENSKTPAFYNMYPEFNHNELNGFMNLPGRFHAVILRDDEEHPRIQKRMEITKKIIRETGTTITEVGIRGENFLSKLLSTVQIGTWTSYYLALAYGTDPTPVPVIEMLKKELK